ncbi:Enolase family protein [Oopsacas minuta]|uniref:phosphopyruvate hydratase n=1 Tax=Oopsacas minuta TaxID=111878 RepID=A0AAV7K3S0_9METZ|nr:Enolase family protein [Oopsacas minuta]
MSNKKGKKSNTPASLAISEEDKVSVEKRKQLSQEAALYYQENNVPQAIQILLNEMFFKQPKDTNGYITRFFSSRALNPIIDHFESVKAIDANCNPATKVLLFAIVKGECELVAESTVSDNFCFIDLENSLSHSNSSITTSKHNLEPQSQTSPEHVPPPQTMSIEDIIKLFSTTLGEKNLNSLKEALISVSTNSQHIQPSILLALSQSLITGLSNTTSTPLYQTIAGIGTEEIANKYTIPHPMYHMLDGRGGKSNIADFFITISPNIQLLDALKYAKTFYDKLKHSVKLTSPLMYDGAIKYNIDKLEQGIELLTETAKELELRLGEDVYIVVNADAGVRWDGEKNKYEINTGQWKSSSELVEYLNEVIRNHPKAVLGIFNAFYEGDITGYSAFNKSHPSIVLFQNNRDSIEKIRADLRPPEPDDKNEEVGNTNSFVLSKRIELPLHVWIEDSKKRKDPLKELGFALMHDPNTEVCSSFNVDLITGLNGSFFQVGSPRDKGTSMSLSRILNIGEELKSKKILKENNLLLQVFTNLNHT